MNENRTINTLFLIQSVDGKISTGFGDKMDVDKDFPKIPEVKDGLYQYYALEKQTDLFFLISGKIFEKIGFNEKTDVPNRMPASSVIIDNKPHLNLNGIKYLTEKFKKIFIITTNKNHLAFEISKEEDNIVTFYYPEKIDFYDMFRKLKQDFNAERVTIQSGGILNAEFLRQGLIDYVSVVIAPCLIGGKDTPSLVDGKSLRDESELFKIKPLKLKASNKLEHSYLHLEYEVMN